jgi:rRNA methylase
LNIINGIDLDLLLEDLAYTKRRVSELEDNQETIVKFLRARFPKYGNQLKRLLQDNEKPKKSSKSSTIFGQEDSGLTTEEAIAQCRMSKTVSTDPILTKIVIRGPKEKPVASANLRG